MLKSNLRIIDTEYIKFINSENILFRQVLTQLAEVKLANCYI